MKKLFFVFTLVLCVAAAFGQSAPFNKGEKFLNFGLGVSSNGIPFYIGFEAAVHPDITVGAEMGYRRFNDHWGTGNYQNSRFNISGLGNYHFNSLLNIPSEWDFYAGLNLGFAFISYDDDWNDDWNSSYATGLILGAQVGGRYFFNNKVGVNLEFAGGAGFATKLGLTVNL